MAESLFTDWGGNQTDNNREAEFTFSNVKILDSTGEDPYSGDVSISGNRIKTITRSGNGRYSWNNGGGQRYDCAGMTLMPGLIDAHLHLSWYNAPGTNSIQMMPHEEHA